MLVVCSLCRRGISLDLRKRGFTKPHCPKTVKRDPREEARGFSPLSIFRFEVPLADAAFRQGCGAPRKGGLENKCQKERIVLRRSEHATLSLYMLLRRVRSEASRDRRLAKVWE